MARRPQDIDGDSCKPIQVSPSFSSAEPAICRCARFSPHCLKHTVRAACWPTAARSSRSRATQRIAANIFEWVNEHVKPHVSKNGVDETAWASFLERIEFVKIDLGNPEDFTLLRDAVKRLARHPRVLSRYGSVAVRADLPRARVGGAERKRAHRAQEKPLGYDLKSSNAINDAVGEIFAEEQIYRIDHYLGKEPVQNLLALRFGNALLRAAVAPRVGGEHPDHDRGRTRCRRRAAISTTIPARCATWCRTICCNCFRSSRWSRRIRWTPTRCATKSCACCARSSPSITLDISKVAVRGQYHSGVIRGTAVPAYATEPGVKPNSTTETFVALKVEIENWRWAGVPFFLRTGKRLADRVAEIVVNFRSVPHSALGASALRAGANRLVIRLQPNETIRLYCLAKQPGEGMNLASVHLDLAFDQFFREGQMEAYQRLLLDVINGRLALFVRRDEQEAAWRWVEPILNEWKASNKPPKPYAAGTWGPAAAKRDARAARHLLARRRELIRGGWSPR